MISEGDRQELRCWADFGASHGLVWKGLQFGLFSVGVFLLLSVADIFLSATPVTKLLQLIEQVLMIAFSARVIYQTWSTISHTDRSDPQRDLDRMPGIFGVDLLYGLVSLLGLVMLVVPGIYISVVGCLGPVFICVEKCRTFDALGASFNLIKGHFWTAFKYLAPIVIVFQILPPLLIFVVAAVGGVVAEMYPAVAKPVESLTIGIADLLSLWTAWCTLCLVSMQVRLYKHLKDLQTEPS